jgi:hypothetical protein
MSNVRVPVMPEPFWHAVVSRTAPIINKAIRRADVAHEYADKVNEQYSDVVDVNVVQLFTETQINAQWQAMYGPAVVALKAMLERYVSLVNSGDAGHWDCETEPVVIDARAALSAITKD